MLISMKRLIILSSFLLTGLLAQAQLFIDNSYTIDDMINGFFNNSGVTISNVTYTGAPYSLAFFEGSQSNIGMNAGLLVTTGDANNAVGPNNLASAGASMGVPGSTWLDALIPGYVTYDASIIEMDIVPTTDSIAFRYVFGSEEYLEFVNTNFNDLFSFFIEGPGYAQGDSIYVPPTVTLSYDSCYICVDTLLIYPADTFCYYDSIQMTLVCEVLNSDTLLTWCYYDQECVPDTITYPGYWYISPGGTNIALIPNTNLPVAINNLNQFVNTQYFYDNAGGSTVQYDAFTTPLWAKAAVTPGQTYHIRIAIADAGDAIFDSGVFLSIESLGGDSLLTVDPEFLAIPQPGTKTVTFDNNTFWATKWHWDFGDGMISEERNPTHTYTTAGEYTVNLTASNWCSQQTVTQTVQLEVSATAEPASDVFRISPNPTRGSFVLDLKHDAAAQVRLLSFDGRLLLDQNLNDGARINLDTYGKGQYILQVYSGNQFYTEKVINH